MFSITHEIWKSFDEGYEAKGIFLDISKAFDKVWYKGILLKPKENGISGNLLNIVKDFLHERKQRVIPNKQYSSGVPQGSALGTLFFSNMHKRLIRW